MKHYFIMNPVSGHKRARERFLHEMTDLETDYELIFTMKKGDARAFSEDIAKTASHRDEDVRIFACGGDGTIHDVVNGAMGYSNVEIGCIPLGTGNDFIRNFGRKSQFMDLETYLDGPSVYCDSIMYSSENRGSVVTGHCVNMVNIGLDCNIVDTTQSVKKIPAVNGSAAYLASVFINLVRKKGENLRIDFGGSYTHDGKLLLISIANGCYCGGGIKGLPKALTDDGYMDVSLVRNVSRLDFVKLFPKYSKGTHLTDKRLNRKNILRYTKEVEMEIEANSGNFKLCIDGEISTSQKASFQINRHAFKFIIPPEKN